MCNLEKMTKKEVIEYAVKGDQKIDELTSEIEDLKLQLEVANGKLRQLRKEKFDTKSEKGNQLELFDEIDDLAVQEEAAIKLEEKKAQKGKGKKERKIAMEELPSNLPSKEFYHDISDEQKAEYGDNLVCIGEDVREILVRIPAHFEKHIHHYPKYAEKNNPESGIIYAQREECLFPKSPIGASVVSHIMTEKYLLGVPLYRQIQAMESQGITFKSQTVAKWVIDASEQYLEKIYHRMHAHLLEEDIINADETHFDIFTGKKNDPEYKRKKSRTYIWMFRSGIKSKKGVITYVYKGGRQGEIATDYLAGYQGYIHRDDYSGYNGVKGAVHCLCNAHARRKFVKLYDSGQRNYIVLNVLDIYQHIFKEDAEIREMYGENYEKIQAERKAKVKPLFELLFTFLEIVKDEVVKKSDLDKAINYVISNKEGLMNFLKDGRLETTNNWSEQMMKPMINNRKNSLFFGSEKGATGSCVVSSIIQTAKYNKLDVERYLTYILEKLSKDLLINDEQLDRLMPWDEEIQNQFGIKKPEVKSS